MSNLAQRHARVAGGGRAVARGRKPSAPRGRPPPVDVEARASDEHHQAIKLWLRLLACTTRIESDIRARLRGEFGITLARFDLLAQLERSAGGLKMGELSRRMMVSGGNVTGLTDELEKEGLVARQDDPADRRAYAVKLTPAGRALFARMAAVHERWVIDLLAGLNGGEKAQVYRLLAKLKQHLAPGAPAAARSGRMPGPAPAGGNGARTRALKRRTSR
jgi:DNA-binding MarR family transcriptional regulator